MRIVNVEAFQPATPGCPEDWRLDLGQVFVRVTLDTGEVGIGIGGGGLAGVHILESVIKDLVLGEEFDHPREIHAFICRETMFYGRKGVVVMAISGLDLAIWDVFAKSQNQPVARVINPDVDLDRAIPMYRTVWSVKDAQDAIAEGWNSIKLHVEGMGPNPDRGRIRAAVSQTREELGDGPEIMVDAFGRWQANEALDIAEAIAEFDVAWLEEPVMPNNVKAYQELNANSPIPIAAGEHEYLVDGFQDAVDLELFSVFQPDINWCGGLTSLLEIYELAEEHDIRVVPHRGAEPYALHAIVACQASPLAESARHWFAGQYGFPVPVRGQVTLDDRPGFGVAVEWPNR